MGTVTALRSGTQSSPMISKAWGEFRMVNPKTLKIDTSYQRVTSTDAVEDIVKNFDFALFQTLDLAERAGDLWIVDGFHRTTAAIELKLPLVPAMIHQSNDPKEEARKFVELQDRRRRLSSVHRYYAKIRYRDAAAVAMQELFTQYKFTIPDATKFGYNNKDNELRCLGSLERIVVTHGKERLDKVLYVLRHGWKGNADAVGLNHVLGLSRYFEYGENTPRQVSSMIRDNELDPFDMTEKATRLAHRNDKSVVDALGDLYHKMMGG